MYIDDVVDSIVLTLDAEHAQQAAYNVGSGVATSVLEVAQTLKRIYGAPGELKVTGDFRLGDIRHNFADVSKIRNELGFQASVSFRDGATRFCDWVRSQTIEDAGYERSVAEMRARGLMN